MARSRFDSYNALIRRRYKHIILLWIVAILVSLVFVPSFFSSVSYDIGNANLGGPTNTESQQAQNIINAEFPSASSSSGNNSIILVIQNQNVYSSGLKDSILALNQTLSKDTEAANFTGISSLYSTEYSLLNSTITGYLKSAAGLRSNITSINAAEYSLQSNLTSLNSEIFSLYSGINSTSQLIYGVPSLFTSIWQRIETQSRLDPYSANREANSTLFAQTLGLGGNQQSIAYYTIFYNVWNGSFMQSPTANPVERESASINQSVLQLLNSKTLDEKVAQTVSIVSTGLNVTTWNQQQAIENLTITSIAPQVPSNLSTSFGESPRALVTQLFDLGPSPENSSLSKVVLTLFANRLSTGSGNLTSMAGELVNDSYYLGRNPKSNESWSLASSIVANTTSKLLSTSPLFTVNASSLHEILSTLNENSTLREANTASFNFISSHSISNYPYILNSSLTKNFVSPRNNTMIAILDFSSNPGSSTIASVKSEVQNSAVSKNATIYVTGSPVITEDVSNAFTPALGVTVGPGVAVSILIVGLLFLAPLAALLPILIGGVSIAIAYAGIYIGIVKIGGQTPTFLTPTLTTLLMLGLAVDYSVLQLRRTREERQSGKSKDESVAISVRWAGEAVLTAGITVVVAYIVMAVANVPLFSNVGTSIALGVSVLLAASLTLLPSLELALGDKIFWPFGIRRRKAHVARDRLLNRLAERTLRRKVLITIVITGLALSAFAIEYSTPTGVDFLKLLPNFPSNQGLTVLTDNLGSSSISPSEIVITTQTPIVYGHNQFNRSLMNEIEKISQAASNSQGVVSVSAPTRPFGSPFNYASLGNLSGPIYSQYLNGITSQIGKNNETALILVGLASQSQTASSVNSLLGIESAVKSLNLEKGMVVYYGGETQATFDSESFINGILPEVVIILAIAVYVILFAQLRSAFTPLRLVFTILCSVAFSLAVLTLVFYYALSLPILDFAPLFVVVTMLGVGIDYDIFFVTRIREEVLKGGTDNDAIMTATSKVWVTIFGLGLVLATVFGSLLVTGIPILQEISAAVASAVLIDVSVVILFFVPSLMGLAQSVNWWPSKRTRGAIGRQEGDVKE